ncbi:MAG: acyltransferase family protein [Sphingomonadales bacterium]|nr:acyltransferase family protein [Sphingomonadales bacterium]
MSLESERRYDIDWLRVIVFGVLILYHVGMMYVSWGWHIKSTYILPWLENVMRLSNPWRLPLLFLISGLAMSFVFGKMPLGRLMRLRAVRLMIPLMVGVTVIVPPQIYYQSLARGYIEPGYLSFLGLYFTSNPVLNDVTPTYTHLWFVAYLMIYSVVALPVFLGLRSAWGQGLIKRFSEHTGPASLLVIPAIPIMLLGIFLAPHFPATHDFRNDWFNHTFYFIVFIYGFLLNNQPDLWRAIERVWRAALAIALGAFLIFFTIRNTVGWEVFPAWADQAFWALYYFHIWTWMLAALGLAQRYLNRPSPMLSYLNQGIFPFYILHQTIIIVVGYHLAPLKLGATIEAGLIVVATFGGCYLLYEFAIRRSLILRPLFGLKMRPAS